MTGFVKVRFTSPVEGIDPEDGTVFSSTRHRLRAVWAHQDRNETIFSDDNGEVTGRWATPLIEQIEWPDEPEPYVAADPPGVGTRGWRDEVQKRYPKAYERWTEREEDDLSAGVQAGLSVEELADRHQRMPGGIMARLVRLGLVEPDTPTSAVGNLSQPEGRPEGGTGR